jgi:addiction module HigA family antidote
VLVERRLPKHRPPTHPGEGLRAEFLIPLGIPQSEFARRLGVSFPRLNGIIIGRRGVRTDTALRLSRSSILSRRCARAGVHGTGVRPHLLDPAGGIDQSKVFARVAEVPYPNDSASMASRL